jgi:hypothetical protein
MQETNRLLAGILAAVEREKSLETQFPQGKLFPEAVVSTPLAAPSKLELAKQWLKDHPEDKKRTGRDLEKHVMPMGVHISHAWWNKAKPKKKREK